MENLKKDSRVVVTEGKDVTWMGIITEVLWNIKPPKRGMTKQGYTVLPESSEYGGRKTLHHSQVKLARSQTSLRDSRPRGN